MDFFVAKLVRNIAYEIVSDSKDIQDGAFLILITVKGVLFTDHKKCIDVLKHSSSTKQSCTFPPCACMALH